MSVKVNLSLSRSFHMHEGEIYRSAIYKLDPGVWGNQTSAGQRQLLLLLAELCCCECQRLGRGCKHGEGRTHWAERTNSLDLSDTGVRGSLEAGGGSVADWELTMPPPTSFRQTSRWQVSAVTKSHLCSGDHPLHSLTGYFIKPSLQSDCAVAFNQWGLPNRTFLKKIGCLHSALRYTQTTHFCASFLPKGERNTTN